jgi:hypothetical protein
MANGEFARVRCRLGFLQNPLRTCCPQPMTARAIKGVRATYSSPSCPSLAYSDSRGAVGGAHPSQGLMRVTPIG